METGRAGRYPREAIIICWHTKYVEYKYDQVSITRGEIPHVYVMDLDVRSIHRRSPHRETGGIGGFR